jgi:hypothetical protein
VIAAPMAKFDTKVVEEGSHGDVHRETHRDGEDITTRKETEKVDSKITTTVNRIEGHWETLTEKLESKIKDSFDQTNIAWSVDGQLGGDLGANYSIQPNIAVDDFELDLGELIKIDLPIIGEVDLGDVIPPLKLDASIKQDLGAKASVYGKVAGKYASEKLESHKKTITESISTKAASGMKWVWDHKVEESLVKTLKTFDEKKTTKFDETYDESTDSGSRKTETIHVRIVGSDVSPALHVTEEE